MGMLGLCQHVFVLIMVMRIEQVTGSGKLELLFIHYDNFNGLGSNGNPCDGILGIARSECDPFFDVCLDTSSGSDSLSSCPVGFMRTGVVHNQNSFDFDPNSIGETPNPLSFDFTEWPTGGVKIKVSVTDDDSSNDNDHVDDLLPLTIDGALGPSAAPFTRDITLAGQTTLSMRLTAYCNSHFYGDRCSVFCEPQNSDLTGHYDCSSDGSKVCHEGWEGLNCNLDTDECASNPCQNGGQCTDLMNKYICLCTQQYTGSNCEASIDDPNPCLSSPCREDATCVPIGSQYTCTYDVESNEDSRSNYTTPSTSGVSSTISGCTSAATLVVLHVVLRIL